MALEELYREVILDHYRNPRHRGPLPSPDAHAEGSNPLCGDEVAIDLTIEDDQVTDIAVSGQGCSISQASASMMASAVLGMKREDVAELTYFLHNLRSFLPVAAQFANPFLSQFGRFLHVVPVLCDLAFNLLNAEDLLFNFAYLCTKFYLLLLNFQN